MPTIRYPLGGSSASCVPTPTQRDMVLSFLKFPRDVSLREKWVSILSIGKILFLMGSTVYAHSIFMCQKARQIRRAYYTSIASSVQTESKADQTCLLYFHCFLSPNREQGRSDVPIILPLLPQSKQRARQIRRAYYTSIASSVQTESKADQTCLLYFHCFLSPNSEQGRSDVPIILPLLPQSKQRARQIRRAYYTSIASSVQTESKADQTCLLYFPPKGRKLELENEKP